MERFKSEVQNLNHFLVLKRSLIGEIFPSVGSALIFEYSIDLDLLD